MSSSVKTSPKVMNKKNPHGNSFEKAKDFKGTLNKLLGYLKEYKVSLVIVVMLAIISTVFSIVGPKILGQATTEIYNGIIGKISGSGFGIDFNVIGRIILTLLLLYTLSFAFSYIQGYIMTSVSMKLTYKLRNDISKKINRIPLGYFDTTNHGEVLSRITNDIDTLSQNLNQSVTQLITSVTILLGIVVMMLTISWQLTLVSACIIPISLLFIMIVVKRSQKYFKWQQEYLGKLNGHIEEMYSGHNVMKAFNGEEDSVEKFNLVLYIIERMVYCNVYDKIIYLERENVKVVSETEKLNMIYKKFEINDDKFIFTHFPILTIDNNYYFPYSEQFELVKGESTFKCFTCKLGEKNALLNLSITDTIELFREEEI